jgi:hypothetical protein
MRLPSNTFWTMSTGVVAVFLVFLVYSHLPSGQKDDGKLRTQAKQQSITRTDTTYNVKSYGAKGDGVTDDTSAIQGAITDLAAGGILYLPAGTYLVSSTLDLSAKTCWTIRGDGIRSGSHNGSTIIGNIAGDLVKFVGAGTGNTFLCDAITFRNTNAAGTALHVESFTVGEVHYCQVAGNRGIYAPQNTFTLHINTVKFNGSLSTFPNGIGLISGAHTVVQACDLSGWSEGIRASGTCVDITGCRLEVNKTALNLGVFADGTTKALSRSMIAGNSMEANDTGIRVVSLSSSIIAGIAGQGSPGSPSGQSQLGIYDTGSSDVTYLAVSMGGTFSQAAMRIANGTPRASFWNCRPSNGLATGKIWDVQVGLSGISFHNCNYNIRPDDTIAQPFLQRHGQFQWLGKINYLNPNVEGKNLSGVGIAVPASAASLALLFTIGHSAGQVAINTATAAQIGGSLAAGTYYYLGTAVTVHGETAGTSEKVVRVAAPNDSVNLTFFGTAHDGLKRRVYRGTKPGVYDGYFELPLNSDAAFADKGSAFTARRSPPISGNDDTSMQEPDANYGVMVTPNWNTTVWITRKATTGFTMNFGTAAPRDGSGMVDWLIVR